jgi:uncharacterized coiled-coil protein SlyX
MSDNNKPQRIYYSSISEPDEIFCGKTHVATFVTSELAKRAEECLNALADIEDPQAWVADAKSKLSGKTFCLDPELTDRIAELEYTVKARDTDIEKIRNSYADVVSEKNKELEKQDKRIAELEGLLMEIKSIDTSKSDWRYVFFKIRDKITAALEARK